MNAKTMIAALAWISRGFAKHVPVERPLGEEEKDEYEHLIKKTNPYPILTPSGEQESMQSEDDRSAGTVNEALKKLHLEAYDEEDGKCLAERRLAGVFQ